MTTPTQPEAPDDGRELNVTIAVEAFVLGCLIGLTRIYNFAKPAIKRVSSAIGFERVSLPPLGGVTRIGEYAVYATLAAFVVLGVVAVMAIV